MRKPFNRVLSTLLSVLIVALIVTPASAVTSTPSDRNTASRSTAAVGLSEEAVAYYTDEVKQYITSDSVYDTFLELASDNADNGSGTSYDATQNNALYDALYGIMSSTHSHAVAYAGYTSNSLASYWLTTDTSDKDVEENSYTFFYSDVTCQSHAKMQREHIWPKSQASFHMKTGLGGSDLHHLRPAYGTVNNIKSNWGFAQLKDENGDFIDGCSNTRTVEWPAGTVSLWRADYEGTTYIDVKDDIRGDIARVLLYVYTRWKQPNLYSDVDADNLPEFDDDDSKNGGKKVIQSLSVLLDWMKNDPVSEWEMKRNDLTEAVQGNRNVFIDYPELAWLLFDKEVPDDMETPSGMAKSGTDIEKDEAVIIDPVTLDFKIGRANSGNAYNGEAAITASDESGKPLMNGSTVERGTPITYTVTPDESTIYSVTFNGSSATNNKMFGSYPIDESGSFSFTKKAGYGWSGTTDTEETSSLDTEPIAVYLKSTACEVYFKVSGLTAGGSSGGSGFGMVAAVRNDTNKAIENGDTVPDGTEVTLTFTPDFGSRYYGLTLNNQSKAAENIEGTDSYSFTTTLSCSGSARKKTFNVKFAQTFAANSKSYINNKGMSSDEADLWADEADFTQNFEICGVQIKNVKRENGEKALRFVSVIDKNILDKAEEYGYVIARDEQGLDRETRNRSAYALIKDGQLGKTVDCTGSDNDYFGDYGKFDTNTSYKYVTAVVNNIGEAAENEVGVNTPVIARPYVVLKEEYRPANGPSVIYGQYMDAATGEAFCACSGSFNYIEQLAE